MAGRYPSRRENGILAARLVNHPQISGRVAVEMLITDSERLN
jgi:hypothetical protein